MNLDLQTITCGVGPLGYVLGAMPTDLDATPAAEAADQNKFNRQRANDIKHRLRQQNMTVKSWCAAHGFKYQTASDVLRGVRKGNFGEGREVAEKLRLI